MAKERENINGMAKEPVANCDQLPEVINIQPMIRIIESDRSCLTVICPHCTVWKHEG